MLFCSAARWRGRTGFVRARIGAQGSHDPCGIHAANQNRLSETKGDELLRDGPAATARDRAPGEIVQRFVLEQFIHDILPIAHGTTRSIMVDGSDLAEVRAQRPMGLRQIPACSQARKDILFIHPCGQARCQSRRKALLNFLLHLFERDGGDAECTQPFQMRPRIVERIAHQQTPVLVGAETA